MRCTVRAVHTCLASIVCTLGFTTSLHLRWDIASLFVASPELLSTSGITRDPDCDESCACKPSFDSIVDFGPTLSNFTVLELGCHSGFTTTVLSRIFHRVISVDVDQTWLSLARSKFPSHVTNVFFILMDLYNDDWGALRLNQIEVVFIDAAHDFASVKSDVINSLRLPFVEWLIFHDYGLSDTEVGRVEGHQVSAVVDEFVTLGLLDCGPGTPPLPSRPPSSAGALGCPRWGPKGPEAVACRVLGRWDWDLSPSQASGSLIASEGKTRRQWLLYEGYPSTFGIQFGALGGPAVACVEDGQGGVDCRGAIQGVGVAKTSGLDVRVREWQFPRESGASGGEVQLVCNSAFTSFRGLHRSNTGNTGFYGFSQAFVLSALSLQIAATEREGACCPAEPVRLQQHARCTVESQLFGPLPAPPCANSSLAPCSAVLACGEWQAKAFNARFEALRFLTGITHIFPKSRLHALLSLLELVRAELPAVWYFTVCISCSSLRGDERYTFIVQVILGVVEAALNGDSRSGAMGKSTLSSLKFEFGNLVYANFLPVFLDTWPVVSH